MESWRARRYVSAARSPLECVAVTGLVMSDSQGECRMSLRAVCVYGGMQMCVPEGGYAQG